MLREERSYKSERDKPSFSSTLLDKIYRSIDDDGDGNNGDLKYYRETIEKKGNMKSNRNRGGGGGEISCFQRPCLVEKWMEKKVDEKANAEKKKQVFSVFSEFERKSHHEREHEHEHDHDFFSSTSISSDTSSGGFSSSDIEFMYCTKTKASCFVPPRPKPVRTSVPAAVARSEKPMKTEKTGVRERRTLFYEQRELQHTFDDDRRYNSASDHTPKHGERSMKIYGNLKKVKKPISPGGRLASFINSLFTTGNNTKKSKTPSSIVTCDNIVERKSKSGHVSTCSSSSSFSRSCLSKNSPSTRERLRNGVKRTVRFSPVSVIVDKDPKTCGQKCLYEEEKQLKFQIMEKTRQVEEIAREFLKEYHQNQKKESVSREIRYNYIVDDMDEDEDDDAASCSSSDLFELDNLLLIGNDRYREELPVYETTHVETNRAIANGLIV